MSDKFEEWNDSLAFDDELLYSTWATDRERIFKAGAASNRDAVLEEAIAIIHERDCVDFDGHIEALRNAKEVEK